MTELERLAEWLGYLKTPLEQARRSLGPSAEPTNIDVVWRTSASTVVEILDYLDERDKNER